MADAVMKNERACRIACLGISTQSSAKGNLWMNIL